MYMYMYICTLTVYARTRIYIYIYIYIYMYVCIYISLCVDGTHYPYLWVYNILNDSKCVYSTQLHTDSVVFPSVIS